VSDEQFCIFNVPTDLTLEISNVSRLEHPERFSAVKRLFVNRTGTGESELFKACIASGRNVA
jgi:hypothetical protein